MAQARSIVVGLVQMRPDPDPKVSLQSALDWIRKAAKKGAQIVVLPELFLGHYFCQEPADVHAFDLAEQIPGRTTKALGEVAKECKVVLIGGSIFEKGKDGKYYNTCPVFEADGKLLGIYRKTHIPQDPGYYEQNYYATAKNPIVVFETSRGRITPLICFDQWSSEAAKVATLQGAELIVYPTAIGNVKNVEQWEGSWQEAWETVQRGHSAANQVFVAAVNRVGTEGEATFWGGSFIAGPFGQVQAHGGPGEEIVLATCDLDMVPKVQDAWGILRNRRPDLYGALVKPSKSHK